MFNSVPSHIYYILGCLEESKDEIDSKMPLSADPLLCLVDYTGFLSVYTDFCYAPLDISDEQLESLIMLQKFGRIKNPYIIYKANEKGICDSINNSENIFEVENEVSKRCSYTLSNGYMSENRK